MIGCFSFTAIGKQPTPQQHVEFFRDAAGKDKMRKFFLAQSGVILLLIYIQMYVQEGTYQVAFQTLGSFLVLISLTFAFSVVVTGARKMTNRSVNFPDGVIKLSIYILPLYYVAQLVGWLFDKGFIGRG